MLKLYYRKSLFEKSELEFASKYFECVDLISNIERGDYVVSRFAMWPFYSDQAREIKNIGATLINSYQQHQYIADLQNWVLDLKELTPETYTVDNIPNEGPFVVKGETNSKKGNWLKDMYAPDKNAAIEIANRLSNDGLIGSQNIYVRKFVPLKTHMIGINSMPVSNEFRFFIGFRKILSGAF